MAALRLELVANTRGAKASFNGLRDQPCLKYMQQYSA